MTELAGIVAVAGTVTPGLVGCTILEVRRRQRRRYWRMLENTKRLELELGIARPLPGVSDDASMAALEAAVRTAVQAVPVNGEHGYDGPNLTDEDVRRLEHPDEFT